jgi:hypothetical protein
MACLLVCSFLFQACQEVDKDFVFELVKKHYPDYQKREPKVIHVKEVDEDFVFELVKKHYPDYQKRKPKVIHVKEVDEDFVFELVKKHYPDCQKRKPKVIHVKKVKMVDGTNTRGLYLLELDMILLSEDADLTVLVHEYRHACGDLLGEEIILPKTTTKEPSPEGEDKGTFASPL